MLACMRGSQSTVLALLSNGVDVTVQNKVSGDADTTILDGNNQTLW
jgi:hypothetical protein